MVEKLAKAALSAEQIGAILEVDHKTIERRFGPVLKKGRQHAHGRLQVKLFQEAMHGNIAALIFLAKNWLGMRDNPDVAISIQQNAYPPLNYNEQVKQKLVALSLAVRREAEREQREAAQLQDGDGQNS